MTATATAVALVVAALCVVGSVVADDSLTQRIRPLTADVKADVKAARQPTMAWKEPSRIKPAAAAAAAAAAGAAAGNVLPAAHSEDFLRWARRFYKLAEYCGGGPGAR